MEGDTASSTSTDSDLPGLEEHVVATEDAWPDLGKEVLDALIETFRSHDRDGSKLKVQAVARAMYSRIEHAVESESITCYKSSNGKIIGSTYDGQEVEVFPPGSRIAVIHPDTYDCARHLCEYLSITMGMEVTSELEAELGMACKVACGVAAGGLWRVGDARSAVDAAAGAFDQYLVSRDICSAHSGPDMKLAVRKSVGAVLLSMNLELEPTAVAEAVAVPTPVGTYVNKAHELSMWIMRHFGVDRFTSPDFFERLVDMHDVAAREADTAVPGYGYGSDRRAFLVISVVRSVATILKQHDIRIGPYDAPELRTAAAEDAVTRLASMDPIQDWVDKGVAILDACICLANEEQGAKDGRVLFMRTVDHHGTFSHSMNRLTKFSHLCGRKCFSPMSRPSYRSIGLPVPYSLMRHPTEEMVAAKVGAYLKDAQGYGGTLTHKEIESAYRACLCIAHYGRPLSGHTLDLMQVADGFMAMFMTSHVLGHPMENWATSSRVSFS